MPRFRKQNSKQQTTDLSLELLEASMRRADRVALFRDEDEDAALHIWCGLWM